MQQMARRMIARTIGKPFDNYALQLLDVEQDEALPWTSSAPRPGLLGCLINDIRINRRNSIVEFGSGVSTLMISNCLEPGRQRMISFEHDEQWADLVSEQLARRGLEDRCQVVHAPLQPCEQSIDGSPWYDTAVVRSRVEPMAVDLVLCDGPSAYLASNRMSRYPAIPVLQDVLAERYSVYLDDIDRSGERRIAKMWSELLKISFTYQLLRGSFAVGYQGQHYNSLI